MKHFRTEDWAEFVRRVASPDKQNKMQKHLDGGCKRCTKTVALWERVRQQALAEATYQPPEGAVRTVKAAYAERGLAKVRGGTLGRLELVFDSFLQPLPAGARAGSSASRQLLYRVGRYHVDLKIESHRDSHRLAVTGQLLDVTRPEFGRRDISVEISNRRGHSLHVVTNQFGEFHAEVENSGDLQLSISGCGEKAIVISLKDVLSQFP
jgi:hypothetical protein